MNQGARKTNWYFVIGGAVLVVCGLVAFFAPIVFMEYLTLLAGVGFMISGVAGFLAYWKVRKIRPSAGGAMFMALCDFVLGILLIVYPIALSGIVPSLLGFVFVIFGLLEAVGIMPFTRFVPESRAIMIISGILAIIVGVMFIIWPSSISLWIAAFALVRGITLIAVGFTQR